MPHRRRRPRLNAPGEGVPAPAIIGANVQIQSEHQQSIQETTAFSISVQCMKIEVAFTK